MRGITVFCSARFSDPHWYVRNILRSEQTGYEAGYYICIALKQRRKLMFKIQWNIYPIICLYFVVIIKRNTPLFSAWCQSKLLCCWLLLFWTFWRWCVQSVVRGTILKNNKILRSCTLKSNARTVLEISDSLTICQNCRKHLIF